MSPARREPAREQLRELVLEGIASGPGSELDEAYFQRLRDHVASAHGASRDKNP